jgi:hypothetical protein
VVCLAGYTQSVHKQLLMGRVPGCANTAGTSLSLWIKYPSILQNNCLNMLYLSKYFGIV